MAPVSSSLILSLLSPLSLFLSFLLLFSPSVFSIFLLFLHSSFFLPSRFYHSTCPHIWFVFSFFRSVLPTFLSFSMSICLFALHHHPLFIFHIITVFPFSFLLHLLIFLSSYFSFPNIFLSFRLFFHFTSI
jgi:hypothetical protein